MQKNPIASTAIGFFCSIGKLVLVEGFRQVGQIVFSWQRGECLSHGRDGPPIKYSHPDFSAFSASAISASMVAGELICK